MVSTGACCACNFQDTVNLSGACGASTLLTFMTLIDNLLRSRCDISDACNRVGRDDVDLDGTEFDFIVVGAGVAGPVVTARLSENPEWKVLLLEAGPEEPTITSIPGFHYAALDTAVDWNYTTVPQENAYLNTGGICKWPRGKMLSGTEGLSAMMYSRGHPSIYDQWSEQGNTGWSFKDLLPYFIKSERNLNLDKVEEGYHGDSGPIPVEYAPWRPPLSDALLAAGVELGYAVGDPNGANQTGISIIQLTTEHGLRATTSKMYLRPNSDRENLHVAINSHVTKILIDNSTLKATGVEFIDKNGELKTVHATKEVILSAGAIGSPQILLLSGIGPQEDLEELDIPVIADLPVGKNLHNHVPVEIFFYINESSTIVLTQERVNEFLNNRTGPLTAIGLIQVTAFFLSKYATDDIPDLQIFFSSYRSDCVRTGIPTECTDGRINTDWCGRRRVIIRPTNIMQKSVGFLKLKSADPLDYPLLDPKYLEDPHDVDVLVDGIKMMINFTKAEALKDWDFQLDTTVVSGCEDLEYGSDEYWACAVRRNPGDEHHQAGTCRMGPEGDEEAVVDPRLRVHGVPNIRIVDASVFPYVPNGNPISAITAAGEKCADMIKEDWA